MAAEKTVLETVASIATLVTPVLLAILGAIGWTLKNKIESARAERDNQQARIRELEDRLREDRIATYNALLDPFFLLFTTEASLASDPKYKNKNKNEIAVSRMMSFEYRQVGFKLSLVANDEVVRAYNSLMQFFYQIDGDQRPLDQKTSHWLALMATLLLEIRRSMGNQSSRLDRWEMIEWFMKDAHMMKDMHERSDRQAQAQ
ncbi:hypothetical protein [Paracidovorax valerianellae]|uniref:Uncharacterized protein n=1 Tax=Paracidovorax valerianellae TaxID=187868 RepID=A0A1G6PQQ1_9BURK|nr:hypothetical protein [Paracidovorax valerianellae]MDA8444951.1 hypothetical protein [Paracidovorax valerianellae]SDC82368.1 hypothetical protein SAMN05192589_103311 [Paracidovorax valerianellae]